MHHLVVLIAELLNVGVRPGDVLVQRVAERVGLAAIIDGPANPWAQRSTRHERPHWRGNDRVWRDPSSMRGVTA